MGRGLVLTIVGAAIGLGSAAAVTRLLQALLFGVDPLDRLACTAATLVLAGAAALASYVPARRALAIDPVETLRAE